MCVYTSAGYLSLLTHKPMGPSLFILNYFHHLKEKETPRPPLPPPLPSTFDTDSRFVNSLASPAMFPNTGAPQPPPPQRTPLIQVLPGCSNTWNGGGGGGDTAVLGEWGGRHGTQKHSAPPSLCLSSIWGSLRCIL